MVVSVMVSLGHRHLLGPITLSKRNIAKNSLEDNSLKGAEVPFVPLLRHCVNTKISTQSDMSCS